MNGEIRGLIPDLAISGRRKKRSPRGEQVGSMIRGNEVSPSMNGEMWVSMADLAISGRRKTRSFTGADVVNLRRGA